MSQLSVAATVDFTSVYERVCRLIGVRVNRRSILRHLVPVTSPQLRAHRVAADGSGRHIDALTIIRIAWPVEIGASEIDGMAEGPLSPPLVAAVDHVLGIEDHHLLVERDDVPRISAHVLERIPSSASSGRGTDVAPAFAVIVPDRPTDALSPIEALAERRRAPVLPSSVVPRPMVFERPLPGFRLLEIQALRLDVVGTDLTRSRPEPTLRLELREQFAVERFQV